MFMVSRDTSLRYDIISLFHDIVVKGHYRIDANVKRLVAEGYEELIPFHRNLTFYSTKTQKKTKNKMK